MSENEMGKVQSSRTPLLLLILVVVVVAAAAVYFFMIQPGQKPADTESLLLNIDELVLRPQDLPGNYNAENTHFTNEHLVNVLGAAKAKTYALQTGRVDGWQVYYTRSSASQLVPEFYFNRTEIFETTEGASLALSEEFFPAYTDDDKAPDEWLDRSCNYGQECILYSYREVKAGAGVATVRIDMAFRYKNVMIWLYVRGQEGEATQEQLFEAAELLIDRIDTLNQ